MNIYFHGCCSLIKVVHIQFASNSVNVEGEKREEGPKKAITYIVSVASRPLRSFPRKCDDNGLK